MARKTDFSAALAAASGENAKASKIDDLTAQIPALRAMQGSLQAIRDLAPSDIDDWGATDRMGDEFTAVNPEGLDTDGEDFAGLKRSIGEFGQQVPILVRPSKTKGRFEIIYGRRRLRACAELGLPVRANVQTIDDDTALLAKSVENAARRPLSFYEKVRFSAAIIAEGQDTAKVMRLLNVTKSGASHLKKVRDNVPDSVGLRIGSAPRSGRPRWTQLAEAFANRTVNENQALAYLDRLSMDTPSDERLDGLLASIARRGAQPRVQQDRYPVAGVTVKTGRSGLNVSVKRSGSPDGFADWLDAHIDEIIKDTYARFKESAGES